MDYFIKRFKKARTKKERKIVAIMSQNAILIVSAKSSESSLSTLGPRKICLELQRIFGKDINLLAIQGRSKWLVKCDSPKEEKIWKKLKLFLGVEITVSESQKSLKAGVISDKSLIGDSDEDILDELRSQGAVKLKNFLSKEKKRGPTFLVYFNTEQLPAQVKIGYLRFKVREYEQDPLRCFQCNRFGHSARNCKEEVKSCLNCAEKHLITPGVRCQKPSKCSNCGSKNHNALSRTCPAYIREKDIVTYATQEKQPVGVIKQQIKEGLKIPSSYAQVVVSSNKSSVETQTEIFPGCVFPPIKLLPPGTKFILPTKTQSQSSSVRESSSSNVEMDLSDVEISQNERSKVSLSNQRKVGSHDPPDKFLRRSEGTANQKTKKDKKKKK